MIEDKYIGLGLAISSSLAIGTLKASSLFLPCVRANNSLGTSFVITKKV